MKRSIIAAIMLLGTGLTAHALETDVWDDIRKPWRSDAEMQGAVKADAKACEREVGVQRGPLTTKFKECMLKHDWTFSHIKPQPARRTVVHRYNNSGSGTSSFDSSNDDAVRNQRDQDNTQQMINNQQSFDNQQRMNDEQASQNQQQMINAQ
jgi:hypothetical protein